MCGICGKISINGDSGLSEDLILKMCGVLKHRGPDDEGVYLNTVNPKPLASLGFGAGGEGCRVNVGLGH